MTRRNPGRAPRRISASDRSPIRSTYLVQQHSSSPVIDFQFVERLDMLDEATNSAVFLLNSPFGTGGRLGELPRRCRRSSSANICGSTSSTRTNVAIEAGMPAGSTPSCDLLRDFRRALPRDEAIRPIKAAIRSTSAPRQRNGTGREQFRGSPMVHSRTCTKSCCRPPQRAPRTPTALVPAHAPVFSGRSTAMMIAGRRQPAAGRAPFPAGWRRNSDRPMEDNIADSVPVWKPGLCMQCGNCVMVCPHATIRTLLRRPMAGPRARRLRLLLPSLARGFPGPAPTRLRVRRRRGLHRLPSSASRRAPCEVRRRIRAINMEAKAPVLEQERTHLEFFDTLPDDEPAGLDAALGARRSVLDAALQFSGACAGCRWTPYLRLLTQLFGDRLLVANATGCSSIYGGICLTRRGRSTAGRGPAWADSLFEDDAEFRLGFRLSLDKRHEGRTPARELRRSRAGARRELLDAPQVSQADVDAQRGRVAALEDILQSLADPAAHRLRSVAKHLVRKSVWMFGGDGWAYDIGYGGSITCWPRAGTSTSSSSTPRCIRIPAARRRRRRRAAASPSFGWRRAEPEGKNLGLMAVAYRDVYVARCRAPRHNRRWMRFSKPRRTTGRRSSSRTATASPMASTCGSGCGGRRRQSIRALAALSLRPPAAGRERQEFVLDSLAPSIPLKAYTYNEIRYKMLWFTNPSEAKRLLGLAQEASSQRSRVYSSLADRWPATTRHGQGEAGSLVPAPAATAAKDITRR